MKDIKRLLINLQEHSPNHWLCKELSLFVGYRKYPVARLSAFQNWIFNVKILFLVSKELKDHPLNLIPTTDCLDRFVKSCINELTLKLPASPLITVLSELITNKSARKSLLAQIAKDPPQDSNLRWLFGLELAELGEKIEHWFYEQLLTLKDDILQNTVVLSSVNFMTNVRNKMHRESDFLIICWKRKLVISVEMKQKITHVNKFDETLEQLLKNHAL